MSLLPVDDALKAITEALSPIDKEDISMAEAAAGDVMGRVLAEDVYAELFHPPHDVSAMDGFAVRHADLADLSKPLKIIGESAAGHPQTRRPRHTPSCLASCLVLARPLPFEGAKL